MLQFHKLSISQLERHIRTTAQDVTKVLISVHARKRMDERGIGEVAVFDCLRSGSIRLAPEPDLRTGRLVCRMQSMGRVDDLAVSVALDAECPGMFVVTVLNC